MHMLMGHVCACEVTQKLHWWIIIRSGWDQHVMPKQVADIRTQSNLTLDQ